MGQTEVKLECGETLDGTGLPAVLSDPIDDLSPGKFWDILEDFLRNRKPTPGSYEVSYKTWDIDDGGFVTALEQAASGAAALIVGNISGTLYTKHYINREENLYTFYVYNTDETLSADSLTSIGHLKAYDDPMRLEGYLDEQACRLHGPLIQAATADSLKKAEYDAEVLASQPSEVDVGKKSVITGPLGGLTIDGLFETMKRLAIEGKYGTETPDGQVLTEQEGFMATVYQTIGKNEDGSMVLLRDFGIDDTLQELQATYYHRLFGSPPRLEVWAEKEELRDGGKKALAILDGIIRGALKFASDGQS